MTPLADNLTAGAVSLAYLVMGAIMLIKAWGSRKWAGRVITGFSAWGVALIYIAPVLLGVPVVELRGALRLALVSFAVNYSVLHRDEAANGLRLLRRRIKQWRLHRS